MEKQTMKRWISLLLTLVMTLALGTTVLSGSAMAATAPDVMKGEDSAMFTVNDGTEKMRLSEALAAQGVSKITLAESGTIYGDYTIPSGVILVIPFDENGTYFEAVPEGVSGAWTKPSVFRKLTIAEGSNLTVEAGGKISVNSKYVASGGGQVTNGVPTGTFGQIQLNKGSNITLKDGAFLYAWGYVTGNGCIAALPGSTVYENFQINDFRGGSATTATYNSRRDYKIFPFSQYYIQNIEAPITFFSGAKEFGYASLYASSQMNTAEVPFIAESGALFNLQQGATLTKSYDPQNDRLILDVVGDMEIGQITMKVMGVSVNSKDFVFPINGNITFHIHSGTTTLSYQAEFLPGVNVIIDNGTIFRVADNTKLYLFDSDEWTGKHYTNCNDLYAVKYSPSDGWSARTRLSDASIQVDGTLQVDGKLFTTSSGANITGGNAGTMKFLSPSVVEKDDNLYGWKDNKVSGLLVFSRIDSKYVDDISITCAQLKNAGGSYTQTSGAAAGATYTYGCSGTWSAGDGGHSWASYSTPASCETDGFSGQKCSTCGAIKGTTIPATGHNWSAWSWEKDSDGNEIKATCSQRGRQTRSCSCGAVQTRLTELDYNNHSLTSVDKVPATCTATGTMAHENCGWCNKNFVDGEEKTDLIIPIDPQNHPYPDPVWEWVEKDNIWTATATFTCTACTDSTEGHTKTETAVVSVPEVVDATCTTKGSETYTATVTVGEGTSKTDTKIVEIAINPEAHKWGGWTTGSESGHTRTCEHNSNHTETASHVWDEGRGTQQATCTEKGVKTFTCSVCSATKTEESDALGHEFTVFQSWGEWTAAEGGYTRQAVVKCSRCDTTEAQAAQVTGPVVEPSTCTDHGSNTYTSTWGEGENQVTDTKVDDIEELAEHIWGEGAVTAEATCTKKGVKTFTCSVCNGTRTEEIDALGHDFDNSFTVDREATCTEKGSKSKHCYRCEAKTDVTEIDTTAHQEVTVAGKPATCTEAGLTAGTKCSVCGSPIKAQATIPAPGHTYAAAVRENEKAASCMEEGSYDDVVYCSVCNEEISRFTTTIAKTAHTMTKTDAKAATCGQNGNTEYYTCKICKNLFTDAEGKNPTTSDVVVIAASEHLSVVKDQAVAPTCTTGGKTEGSHCEACNTVIVQQKDIPATGHKFSETTTPATCTADGVKVSTCTACNSKESTSISKLGHIYGDWKTVRQATCTEAGEQQRTCTRDAFVEIQPIPATGHDYTGVQPEWNWHVDNSADASFACAACHETTVVIATVTHEVTQATCTGEGMTIYTAKATFNGTEYTTTKDSLHVAPTGHAYANPSWSWSVDFHTAYVTFTCTSCGNQTGLQAEITQEIKDASCTADGSITYTATVWTDELRNTVWAVDSQVKTITASGHLPTPIFAIPASCESSGWTEGTRCSVCQEILASPQEIPATGHDWLSGRTEVTVQPTCSAEGVQIRHCAKDDSHTQTEAIQKLEHNTVSIPAVPATCIEAGHSAYTHCGLCGQDFGKEVYSPTGHHYGTPVYTWQQNDLGGWAAVARFICDNCVSFQDVNASEIKSEDTRTATCMEDGNRHFTAVFAFNGNSYTSEKDAVIPALGHKAVVDAAKAPTCTETGLTEGSHCETCGSVLTAQETVDATGHYYEMAWLWTETGASLNVVCRNDQTHAGSVQATVEQSTTPATIQAAGKTVYTATVVFDGKEYTAKREVTIPQLATPDYSTPSDPVIFPPVSVWTSDPTPSTGSTVTNIDDFETPLADMFGIGTVNGKGNSQFVITVTDITHESDMTTHGNETVIAVTAKLGDTVMKTVPGGITAAVPVENLVSGTVAVLVRSDGTEQVIRKSVTDGNTLYVPLDGTANIVVRDNSKRFVDVHDRDWYAPAVAFVSSHDLFGGTTPTTFEPSTAMSRAMLAKVLHNLEDNPHPTSVAQFTDMKDGEWYNNAVSWASEQQIITGYPDGRFGVNDDVSREDMIVMLWRYAGKPTASTSTLLFSDADKVSSYAREAMLWATENRLISGKGENKLDPLGNAQRSEVAQIIQNYVRYLVK